MEQTNIILDSDLLKCLDSVQKVLKNFSDYKTSCEEIMLQNKKLKEDLKYIKDYLRKEKLSASEFNSLFKTLNDTLCILERNSEAQRSKINLTLTKKLKEENQKWEERYSKDIEKLIENHEIKLQIVTENYQESLERLTLDKDLQLAEKSLELDELELKLKQLIENKEKSDSIAFQHDKILQEMKEQNFHLQDANDGLLNENKRLKMLLENRSPAHVNIALKNDNNHNGKESKGSKVKKTTAIFNKSKKSVVTNYNSLDIVTTKPTKKRKLFNRDMELLSSIN